MLLSWWLWLLLGFVLLLLELVTPGGFYIFFFGVGAIAVGLLAVAGVAGPASVQWLLFGVISIVAFLLFRKPLIERFGTRSDRDVDTLVGETAVALGEIGIQQIGKAELRGTAWSARNVGTTAVKAGERCRVEQVDGLMLWIRGNAA
jgi:membrane protein implicated in regulation of membrane protease activity